MADRKWTFFFLWLACIVGSAAVIPYLYFIGLVPPQVSFVRILTISNLQAAVIYGFVCVLSYFLLPKTDLEPFQYKPILKRVIYPAIFWGTIVGLTIFFIEKSLFLNSQLSSIHPPFWAGLLASLYGAINEEILLRLFLLTFVYWALTKALKLNRKTLLWIATLTVALIFGLGHLPAALKLGNPTFLEIGRVLLLNGLAGTVFGWLYWSKGLWTAMGAHFVVDILIHAFLTLIK